MGNNSFGWNRDELDLIRTLTSPERIQSFIDGIAYNPKDETNSPRQVLVKSRAHCVEGALMGAAFLHELGHRPLVVDMRAVNDDDHVIAVFRNGMLWGAVAKSNFTTLRFREPVYRSIRELVMSYFDFYFNSIGEKTLRAYSPPLDLSRFDDRQWKITGRDLDFISNHLDHMRHYPVISSEQGKKLVRVPRYLLEAGLLGSDPDGLYKPKK